MALSACVSCKIRHFVAFRWHDASQVAWSLLPGPIYEADGGMTQRRRFLCRISFVARALCQWFPVCVTPCAARSSVQVTWTRGRGHPTVPGARWRSPLALTSDHPPPIHPFFFEAVAPRKLVSQLREITFSGPLASFVGKNFDIRHKRLRGGS